jgi:hypothetical protein
MSFLVPLQASLPVPGAVPGIRGVAHAVEEGQVGRFLFAVNSRGQIVGERNSR